MNAAGVRLVVIGGGRPGHRATCPGTRAASRGAATAIGACSWGSSAGGSGDRASGTDRRRAGAPTRTPGRCRARRELGSRCGVLAPMAARRARRSAARRRPRPPTHGTARRSWSCPGSGGRPWRRASRPRRERIGQATLWDGSPLTYGVGRAATPRPGTRRCTRSGLLGKRAHWCCRTSARALRGTDSSPRSTPTCTRCRESAAAPHQDKADTPRRRRQGPRRARGSPVRSNRANTGRSRMSCHRYRACRGSGSRMRPAFGTPARTRTPHPCIRWVEARPCFRVRSCFRVRPCFRARPRPRCLDPPKQWCPHRGWCWCQARVRAWCCRNPRPRPCRCPGTGRVRTSDSARMSERRG